MGPSATPPTMRHTTGTTSITFIYFIINRHYGGNEPPILPIAQGSFSFQRQHVKLLNSAVKNDPPLTPPSSAPFLEGTSELNLPSPDLPVLYMCAFICLLSFHFTCLFFAHTHHRAAARRAWVSNGTEIHVADVRLRCVAFAL